jgi:hypothetical protein
MGSGGVQRRLNGSSQFRPGLVFFIFGPKQRLSPRMNQAHKSLIPGLCFSNFVYGKQLQNELLLIIEN